MDLSRTQNILKIIEILNEYVSCFLEDVQYKENRFLLPGRNDFPYIARIDLLTVREHELRRITVLHA